jgi:hypothetical protein
MASVTPTASGVVNIPGPLTRHLTGQIFTFAGVAGTSGGTTAVNYTTFTANAGGTRVTVNCSAVPFAAIQIFNLDSSAAIFVSVDGEDPTADEASPIPALNGFQIDQPSAALALDIWSAAGGEAFTVRGFAQSVVVP